MITQQRTARKQIEPMIHFTHAENTLENLPVSYTEVDAAGILTLVNHAACMQHHLPAREILGRSVFDFVPKEEAALDRDEFFRAIQSSEDPPIIRRTIYTPHGGYQSHELHRRMLRDDTGRAVGMSCITFNVSELEEAHLETRRTKLWLESALHAIPQSVIITDALGFVRYINPSAEVLTGWSSTQMLGQQIEKGMPILRAISSQGKPLNFRSTLDETWNGDVDILTRDRQTVSVWLSASPILDRQTGYTNGVIITLGVPKAADA
jgi:PAS domain S-box-containing protein